MKRKMIIAVVFILALVTLMFVIGLSLPAQREFVMTADLKSSPDRVFQLVTDVENQTAWRDDVQEIKVVDATTWTEIPKKGTPITFRSKQKVQNQLFEIEIIEPKNFSGYWVGTFQQIPTGTKVTFKEVIVIKNPFFRVLSFIFVDLNKTIALYLRNLKAKLGE